MSSEMILRARSLGKTFDGQRAVFIDDFALREGEIRGLVGENGSGKSTFIKMLSGYHAPDPGGSLEVAGQEVSLPVPISGHGTLVPLRFVHQDLGICDTATVLENFTIQHQGTAFGWRIRQRAERERARAALDEFDVRLKMDALAGELSSLDRALLAIVRAVDPLLHASRGVLILDEPTAALDLASTRQLLEVLQRLAKRGITILLVSHRLDEITEVTDQVTVLRDGELVETMATEGLTHDRLADSLVGFRLESLYPQRTAVVNREPVALKVDGLELSSGGVVDLTLGKGEVVGLTGLSGSGYEEIPYRLFGARSGAGTMHIGARDFDLQKMNPRRAIAAGLAFVPASRARFSGSLTATARENMTITAVARRPMLAPFRANGERDEVVGMMRELDVRPVKPELELAGFSGGNQQKALLAKWFRMNPDVLLLHEPTEGVDIGAKKHIFGIIAKAVEAGMSVLISSAEFEDLAHLCDRVIVFHRDGTVKARAEAELSYQQLMTEAMTVGTNVAS